MEAYRLNLEAKEAYLKRLRGLTWSLNLEDWRLNLLGLIWRLKRLNLGGLEA